VKTPVYVALTVAAVLAAGCSASASTASGTFNAAPSRSPAPPSPSARPSPSTVPLAATAACKDVIAVIKNAESQAESPAKAKQAQTPDLNLTDLEQAELANELTGSAGAKITAEETAPGVTASLSAAERSLVSNGKTWHDWFGTSQGNAAAAKVVSALTDIQDDCGN
jgi:hypothetical protein